MAHQAIIINKESGTGVHHKSLYKALEGQGNTIEVFEFDSETSAIETVKKAWDAGHNIIIAAGGDGTISCVASAILELGITAKLGVIPLGTLNHFAQDLHIPLTISEALETIQAGKTTYVDVAKVNSRYFINNSSLGIYPFLVTERDTIKRKGFRKWLRFMIAAFKAFKKYPFVRVTFTTSEKTFERKTPFVFIGNNTYHMRAGTLGTRKSLDEGKLSLFIAHKGSRLRLIMLAWHAWRGKITEQKDFDSIGLSTLEIHSNKKRLKVACDGEVYLMKTPIHYSIAPKALHVIIP
jgi:YegS/Rv2252/BmrU family lipid kinase